MKKLEKKLIEKIFNILNDKKYQLKENSYQIIGDYTKEIDNDDLEVISYIIQNSKDDSVISGTYTNYKNLPDKKIDEEYTDKSGKIAKKYLYTEELIDKEVLYYENDKLLDILFYKFKIDNDIIKLDTNDDYDYLSDYIMDRNNDNINDKFIFYKNNEISAIKSKDIVFSSDNYVFMKLYDRIYFAGNRNIGEIYYLSDDDKITSISDSSYSDAISMKIKLSSPIPYKDEYLYSFRNQRKSVKCIPIDNRSSILSNNYISVIYDKVYDRYSYIFNHNNQKDIIIFNSNNLEVIVENNTPHNPKIITLHKLIIVDEEEGIEYNLSLDNNNFSLEKKDIIDDEYYCTIKTVYELTPLSNKKISSILSTYISKFIGYMDKYTLKNIRKREK